MKTSGDILENGRTGHQIQNDSETGQKNDSFQPKPEPTFRRIEAFRNR
uniref:Uncharacterized protein n=1 Tax=Tetraselmis sp. GSL018 TaxID=582737 RepID=A0A061R1W4_9CHLO